MTAALDNLTRRLLSSLPEGAPASEEAKEALRQLLGTNISGSDYGEMLWKLAGFYIKACRNDIAMIFVQAMMESTDDAEEQADYYLRLGQLSEQEQNYAAACDYYLKGLELKPTRKDVAYLLYNNLGYCLNLGGAHEQAERLCRAAIEIDSQRANAFKNLGISLAGQNDLIGAAWAWIEAIKANPKDARSLILLEQLIADHPEIAPRLPGNWQEVEACQKLVRAALGDREEDPIDTYEICQLRYVPEKGYFQIKDGVESETSAEEIEGLYSEEALKMLREYPGTWCAIRGEGAEDASRADEANRNEITSMQLGSLQPVLLIRDYAAKH
jgi:tetratricopeptide (TPR) repeat protein